MGMLLVMCPNTGQPISTGIETDEYSLRQIAGAAGDWCWEVTSRGEIIARGLAATQAVARAEAMRAARSHVDPPPENLPSYLEEVLPPSPRFGAA
jgi:hypothetical protein